MANLAEWSYEGPIWLEKGKLMISSPKGPPIPLDARVFGLLAAQPYPCQLEMSVKLGPKEVEP